MLFRPTFLDPTQIVNLSAKEESTVNRIDNGGCINILTHCTLAGPLRLKGGHIDRQASEDQNEFHVDSR